MQAMLNTLSVNGYMQIPRSVSLGIAMYLPHAQARAL